MNKFNVSDGLGKMTEELNEAFEAERLPFRRNLDVEEIRKLKGAVSLAFSMEICGEMIERVMHYCYYVERQMKGRAAGNIEDMIIRYLFRYYASLLESSDDEKSCHMEIGVLFGAATIYACHAVQLAKKDIVTIAVDPLAGYYGQDLDVICKLEINEETFFSNLKQFGFRDRVRLLKGYSEDEEIISQTREYRILSLIIDGDHSYEGVKADWINYAPLVVPGGYVLIDDYNNPAWKEVTDFVNREVLSNLAGKWEVVLVFGHSLILKRTDVKYDEETEQIEKLIHDLKGKERLIEKKDEIIIQKDEKLRHNNTELEQKIKELHDSLSWKVTAPIRHMGSLFVNRK